MCGFEFGDDEPGYFVFDVPVSVYRGVFADKARKKPDRMLQPVLAIRAKGNEVVVPDESLSWSRNLIEQMVPAADIRRKLNTVGRLFEFGNVAVGDRFAEEGTIDLVVWQYLLARAENPLDPSRRRFPHWQPIRYEGIHIEFRDLVDFARFCADYTGESSVIGGAFKKQSKIWMSVKRNSPPEDFLIHLEAQRDRWSIIRGDDEVVAPPSILKRIAVQASVAKSGNVTSLSVEEIDALIDLENNFMFKALWILLAYVGPRISEALNMFVCDVIDPAFAKKLFLADFDGPVALFADPRKSRFIGSSDRRRSIQTRTEYLDAYGLKPRPDYGGKSMRAGWKGMTVFNPEFLITHGSWTCKKRAAQFADLLDEIRAFHADVGTHRMHPYLFVNARNAEYLGECLKMSNVKKAYDRACVRAGIEPHSLGASLHGFRHYYAWYAKHVLHLDEETVQRMLRQKSPLSQRTYGKRPSDVRDAMEQFAKGRRLEA
jgi:integrase